METTLPPAAPALEAAAAPPDGVHSLAAEVASWMLEGRFFTVDTDAAITMWSPKAVEAFGWSRRDIVRSSFVDTLVAPGERDEHAEGLRALLGGAAEPRTFRTEVEAVDAEAAHMRVAFAAVRIHVGVGYEFNALLQEIASSSQTARSLEQLKMHGEAVLALIDDAVQGRHVEFAESEDARRLAGALVVFRVLERSAPPPTLGGDSRGDAAPSEVQDALRDAKESRARADSARLRMEDAIAECERLRGELAEIRSRTEAEATGLRAELAAAREQGRSEAERLRTELTDANRQAAIDAERSREALVRTRGEARADVERLEAELLETREGLAAEVDRLLRELEGSRERGDGAVGRLTAELEALSAEAAQARALAERTGAELERTRSELEQARSGGSVGGGRRDAEMEAANAHAEAMRTELAALAEQAAQGRAQADLTRSELEHAEAEVHRLRGELETARLAGESAEAQAKKQTAALSAERDAARADLDAARAGLTSAREDADRAAAETGEQIDQLSADVERLTTELAAARKDADRTAPRSGPKVVPLTARAAPPVPKERASQYLDFLLTDEVAAEKAAPPPREPIAIDTLLRTAQEVDAKNPYTRRHSERVAGYAAALAEGLGFERARIEAIRQAALLHDVGKSEVADAIVAKDDPLNLEELDELARHSQIGHELLVAAGEPKLAEWVRHVHERYDGGGHPAGLAAADIPEESRVLHVADALDHMTRPRAYRHNRPVREALAELAFCAGTRLDPRIATTLIELVEGGRIAIEGAAGRQRVGRPLGRPRGGTL